MIKLQKNKIVVEPKLKYANLKLEIKEKSELIPLKLDNVTFGYKEILFKNLTFSLTLLPYASNNNCSLSSLLKLL